MEDMETPDPFFHRCGQFETEHFFRVYGRAYRKRIQLSLIHISDNAHVSEANNIYLKIFIVLLLSVYKYLTLK